MARVLAFTEAARRQSTLEALRVVIVCGCALALIAAGHPLAL
jgi:hypothetical protein